MRGYSRKHVDYLVIGPPKSPQSAWVGIFSLYVQVTDSEGCDSLLSQA